MRYDCFNRSYELTDEIYNPSIKKEVYLCDSHLN